MSRYFKPRTRGALVQWLARQYGATPYKIQHRPNGKRRELRELWALYYERIRQHEKGYTRGASVPSSS